MSAEITLTGAITGLVTEKRAVGYKYVSEERALARFEVFCAGEFPGLETVTRASVEAWIAAARRRAVKPATLQSLAAPVRELARWFHRRGVNSYVLPAGVLEKPSRYVPHIYSDRELAALFAATDRCHYCSEVPFRHLVMPVLSARSTRAGCAAQKLGCCASPMSRSTRACCRSGMRKAATTGSCPSQSRCANGSPATTQSSPDSQAGSGSSPARRRACR